VGAPGAEQAEHAAAADVDHVAGHQVALHVADARPAPEERHVRRLAVALAERAVEADDVVVGVAARGRKEADLRPVAGSERQDVVVEQRVAGLHREATAAERDYLRPGHAGDGDRPAPVRVPTGCTNRARHAVDAPRQR
jgi:hypothetical protein